MALVVKSNRNTFSRIQTIDINTSGLPARNIFAWIFLYQLKITKADEYTDENWRIWEWLNIAGS